MEKHRFSRTQILIVLAVIILAFFIDSQYNRVTGQQILSFQQSPLQTPRGSGLIGGPSCGDGMCTLAELTSCQSDCNIIHAWNYNEGSGSIAQDTVGGHDGTLTGNVQWELADCYTGNCISFTGGHVAVPTYDNPQTNTLTFAAWIKPRSFSPSDARIISESTGTGEQDHCFMASFSDNPTVFRTRIKTGGTFTHKGGTLSLGTWQHVAAVYDGNAGTVQHYIDGIPVTMTEGGSQSGVLTQCPGVDLWHAQNPDGYGASDMIMDSVYLYDRALVPTEINALAGNAICGNNVCEQPTENPCTCVQDCPASQYTTCGDGCVSGNEQCEQSTCQAGFFCNNCQSCDPIPACQDGIDNDNDGWTDYPADPGCVNANDIDELNGDFGECANNVDDEPVPDGLIDGNDPMCNKADDPTETAQCQDGIDNDNDGFTDYPQDADCFDANQDSEEASFGCDCGLDVCYGNEVVDPSVYWTSDNRDITFTFNCDGGPCQCGQYATGDYWVVDDNLIVTSITPDQSADCLPENYQVGDQCRNGFEINPTDRYEQALDDRMFCVSCNNFNPNLGGRLPYNAQAAQTGQAESILKAMSLFQSEIDDNQDDTPKKFSRLRRVAVLTIEPSAPQDPQNKLRPPFYGNNKPNFDVDINDIDTSIFGSLPDIPGCCPNEPSFEEARVWFAKVHHAVYRSNYYQSRDPAIDNYWDLPVNNMEGYHQDMAAINSAMPFLMLRPGADMSDPIFKAAVIGYLQLGFDIFWPMHSDSLSDSGHGMYKRTPVHMLAYLLQNNPKYTEIYNHAKNWDGYQEIRRFHYNMNNAAVWGGIPQTEYDYWEAIASNAKTGKKKKQAPDPYNQIDGTYIPAYGYIKCCYAKPVMYTTGLVQLLSSQALWNYDPYLDFGERWRSHGALTLPDTCAPYDGAGSGDMSNYEVTFGPAPGNAADCHLDHSCQCIQGSGRFPDQDGVNAGSGDHGRTYNEEILSAYVP